MLRSSNFDSFLLCAPRDANVQGWLARAVMPVKSELRYSFDKDLEDSKYAG